MEKKSKPGPKKKHLGQHFLTDTFYIEQIISAFMPKKTDDCIEIGPGAGVLTDQLIEKVASYVAVEIDVDLYEYLEKRYQNKAFLLIKKDILTLNPQQDLKESDKKYRWVGNLPYNISTPFFIALIAWRKWISDGLFMVQKEVALRMVAKPGTEHYGRLTVALMPYFEIKEVLDVPPSAFNPPPKVDSSVVSLKVRENIQPVSKHFHAIVALCFQKRRKMLRSIFNGKINDEEWQVLGIENTLRPEVLTVKDFYRLSDFLVKKTGYEED